MERARTRDIRQFILTRTQTHPGDVARWAAQEYGISRQAVNRHLQALIDEGLLEATGRTRARRYRLLPVRECTHRLNVTPVLTEDGMWNEYVRPLVEDVPPNIRAICHYGFTDIAANAIEHARAERIALSVRRTATSIDIAVTDNGVGIFVVLAETFGFADPREAVFELSKGRLTTAPALHRGGSLFLVSRMFDRFELQAGDTTFTFDAALETWDVTREPFRIHGTSVRMHTSLHATRELDSVIETWTTDRGELSRAHVPVALLTPGGEELLSRSQGRRLVRRLGQCKEALLDFRGVASIGRGFADEVFRVFHAARPDTSLVTLHANHAVRTRIREALEEGPAPPAGAGAASTKDERPARM